jgi:nicotinamide-nucleotide amidase
MRQKIEELSGRIMRLAHERRMTLATVESCTAGSLAHLLSQAEGASDTLHGGFVVYTKENKAAAVGVSKELLAAHTAVSAEVAQAMAKGGLARCPADVVVAVTGVAGPEPDEDGNPVGLVYVAAAARDGRTRFRRHDFGKRGRDEICSAAMEAALALLKELLTAQLP